MQCQMNGEVAIIIVYTYKIFNLEMTPPELLVNLQFSHQNDRKGPVFFNLCVYFNIAHGKTVL